MKRISVIQKLVVILIVILLTQGCDNPSSTASTSATTPPQSPAATSIGTVPTGTPVEPTPTAAPIGTTSTTIPIPSSGTTTRVSVSSDGTEGNDDSWSSSISADGRYVAFDSAASNLVSGDMNGKDDVFVHDLVTGETTLISVASDGTQGNQHSFSPFISADGRYVAFVSVATNLVSGDTNVKNDIFVHDRDTGETTRVSVASDGTEGNETSNDPTISADGRYVAFDSDASNLVKGDTNEWDDVFVHDLITGETTRVSVASDGAEGNRGSHGPYISADGQYVAFGSRADNLVNDDTNGSNDIFVHDLVTGETTRVSVASDGTEVNNSSARPSISADGRYVAFESVTTDPDDSSVIIGLVDIFVHDLVTGETTRVSVASDDTDADKGSYIPSISADGRYVAFWSDVVSPINGDTTGPDDIFVHDLVTGETTQISTAGEGPAGDAGLQGPPISADGRYITFYSYATNLVSGDTNGMVDVFVHDRGQ